METTTAGLEDRRSRRAAILLTVAAMTLAVLGSLVLRSPAQALPAAGLPATFGGTALVEFPGSGVGPITLPAIALISGSGTTISDVQFGTLVPATDGAFGITTLGTSWNLQSPFSNYAKGTITSANSENTIQSPPSPTTSKEMANNTKIRVTIYNANQGNVLIQVEGTSGGKNFRITFTGANCGLIVGFAPGCSVPI